jgi:hypothetical protein
MPNIRKICTIQADMKKMVSALEKETSRNGKFWELHYKVIISFKGTTLQGKLAWIDEVC